MQKWIQWKKKRYFVMVVDEPGEDTEGMLFTKDELNKVISRYNRYEMDR